MKRLERRREAFGEGMDPVAHSEKNSAWFSVGAEIIVTYVNG